MTGAAFGTYAGNSQFAVLAEATNDRREVVARRKSSWPTGRGSISSAQRKETAKANERPIKVCSTFLCDCMQMFYRMSEMGDNHKDMIVSTRTGTNVGI